MFASTFRRADLLNQFDLSASPKPSKINSNFRCDPPPTGLTLILVAKWTHSRYPISPTRTHGPHRKAGAYPNFEMGGTYKAVAVTFSDDGATLYVATSTTVFSIVEAGDKSTRNWSKETDDKDLCDIAVNGMSVRLHGPKYHRNAIVHAGMPVHMMMRVFAPPMPSADCNVITADGI